MNGIVFVIRMRFEHQGLICSIVVSAAQICVFAWLLCQLDEKKLSHRVERCIRTKWPGLILHLGDAVSQHVLLRLAQTS